MSDYSNVTYNGEASMPIVAFDFDGVVAVNSEDSHYPSISDKCENKDMHMLINYLHDIGVKVGIWTCREHEARRIMEEWLNKHNYKIDFINDTSDYAPYVYNPRKIFAHLYVDDRGYGWHGNSSTVCILRYFLKYTCRKTNGTCLFSNNEIDAIINSYVHGYEIDNGVVERLKHWRD